MSKRKNEWLPTKHLPGVFARGVPDTVKTIEGHRNAVMWQWRTLDLALSVLQMPEDEYQRALRDDRLPILCQVIKMLSIDQGYAWHRAQMLESVSERIAASTIKCGHPEIERLLFSPIDFSLLPEAPGMTADAVNGVRP
jgi:hypothetical protein